MILKLSKRNFLIVCFTFLFSCISFANDDSAVEEKPTFNINETIFGHIGDNHDWHMWDYNGHAVGFPLPVILVNTNPFSIDVFMSSEFEHGHKTVTKGDHTYKMVAKEMGGQDIFYVENGEVTDKGPLDFSITKNVFTLFLVAIIMLVMFIGCARAYKRRPGQAPKGFQAWLEPVILFIKEDVIEPNLGRHADKYTPYLLTVFFFIWISNMMGLIPFFPGSANLTGNIAVTFVLAMFTLLITNFSGNKEYWKDIFCMPGLPWPLIPIMAVVEVIGIFTKPFALMIRLFANITAGHIIVLSLTSLIFIFGTLAIAPVSVFFVMFMDVLELFVAALQAYIFTMLSALFIGLAMPEGHEA
ncbi:MAG: F0F1 ATP synthase subunit A [Bacteroidales bacterium]|nr:F0F1 ATP synthase subunit A [Bacteroidales bacterium]